jgi:hypothetical protein
MQNEIWKDIYEFEAYYQVSNLGRVRSKDRYVTNINGNTYLIESKIRKTRTRKDGCVVVKLSKNGIIKEYYLARIVYKAFNLDFDLNDNNIMVWHKDEDQENNKLDNLITIKRHDIPPTENWWEKKHIICITTNKEFKSVAEGEKYYGIKNNCGNISKCCNGKQKSAGKIILDDGTVYKLEWKYVD